MSETRLEHDLLGDMELPADVLWGIHTARALENFPATGRPVSRAMIAAYGQVKLACVRTLIGLGHWADDTAKAEALERACGELSEGLLDEWIVVDLMQGGAGTSLNMNVNEVIANRSLQLLGEPLGNYNRVSPLDDVNRGQSTNDTYPTALKVAAMKQLTSLEQEVVALQEAFQDKEKEFSDVVKVGRTQFQDAVLTTLGREMGAYAEALSRDRWRIYKCQERLRVVNLGGTAIGSGLGAEQRYIFRVTDVLRDICGLGLARAENLTDATQHVDVFVEVSGIIKAHAVNLIKICNDLRLMSSGPQAGLGEITLPARQAGSSIMPGKVNPVICEYAIQAAQTVCGHDVTLTQACAAGSLELNAFLPITTWCLLDSIAILTAACQSLRSHCVTGITANREACLSHVENSTALVTALVPLLGYDRASDIAKVALANHQTIRQVVLEQGLLSEEQINAQLTPEAVCRLGHKGPAS